MGKFTGKHAIRLRSMGIAVVLMASVACSPIIRNHGFVPTEIELASVVVGVDTRETVTANIGPPTASGVSEGNVFYYVSSTFRHFGAFAPQEIDRQVLAISFDDAERVRNIERFTLEDGNVIVLSRRVTDDGIRDTTFIRQLLGSFGRVDAGTFLGSDE